MKKLILLLLFPALLQAQTNADWLTPIANIEFKGDKIVYRYVESCPFDDLKPKIIHPDLFTPIAEYLRYANCDDTQKYKRTVLAYLNGPSTPLESNQDKIRYIKTFALQTLWAINDEPLSTGRPVEIIRQLAASPGKETSHTASIAMKLYDKIKTSHTANTASMQDYTDACNIKIKKEPLFSNQLIPANPPIKSVKSDSVCWPKLYGEPNSYELSFDVEDANDGGYYILGNITNNLVYEKSWLIKTDVNGEILWEKIFSDSGHNLCLAMEPTLEGGVLLCGWVRHEGEENSNPSVIKLDACGEKLWCRIFSENIGEVASKWANDVKETPSGDIIVLVNEYGYHPINTMHLFKLNADGEVLWRNPYASAYQHPGSINPFGSNLKITSNHDYLIAGEVYWEDDWNPGGPMGIRSLFVLVDSLGNEKWVLPFGTKDTIYGQGQNIYEINSNSFIGVANKWPVQTMQTVLINFDSLGTVNDYLIIDNDSIGPDIDKGVPLDFLRIDSVFVLGGIYGTVNQGVATEIIIDTNIFNNLKILNNYQHNNCKDPYSMRKTIHSKILSNSTYVVAGSWDISLSKLNQNLEYDTLDPGNYTYDSLCTTPGLPQSGFISLDDCDLFTAIDEIPTAKQYQEKIRWIPIKAYPNPVTEGKLTLEFENTIHHKNMELHCYDDFGRQIHHQKIYKGQQDTDVDVAGWPPGIYIAVVYSEGSARGKAKFVVR